MKQTFRAPGRHRRFVAPDEEARSGPPRRRPARTPARAARACGHSEGGRVKAVKADPRACSASPSTTPRSFARWIPRSSRELFWLILLGAVLVLGGVLYAWPHLQLREAGKEAQELSREKERLLEENRKLRLEKAALENLRRVETIASRDLGLAAPAPEDTIVVEMPPAAAPRRGSRGPRPPTRPRGRGTRRKAYALEPHPARGRPDAGRQTRGPRAHGALPHHAAGPGRLPVGARDRAAPRAPAGPGASRSSRSRARARASARSPSKRGAAPSSTAPAVPSRCRWTRRASTPCPRT